MPELADFITESTGLRGELSPDRVRALTKWGRVGFEVTWPKLVSETDLPPGMAFGGRAVWMVEVIVRKDPEQALVCADVLSTRMHGVLYDPVSGAVGVDEEIWP